MLFDDTKVLTRIGCTIWFAFVHHTCASQKQRTIADIGMSDHPTYGNECVKQCVSFLMLSALRGENDLPRSDAAHQTSDGLTPYSMRNEYHRLTKWLPVGRWIPFG